MAEAKPATSEKPTLLLVVNNQDDEPLKFKVKYTTRMDKVSLCVFIIWALRGSEAMAMPNRFICID